MDQGTLQVVLWVGGAAVAMIGGLATAVFMLVLRNQDRFEAREGVRDSRDDGRERDTSRLKERLGDKQSEHGEELAAMRADIARLKDESGKCDELDRDVAVLKDFKTRAEAKFDEVDDVSKAQERLGEQMRTVFKRLDMIDEKIDRVPRETAEMLRTMIRPVQPSRVA